MRIKIESLADIARLPWAGNFADDAPLFDLVDEFRAANPEQAEAADRLASLHGCGEAC